MLYHLLRFIPKPQLRLPQNLNAFNLMKPQTFLSFPNASW